MCRSYEEGKIVRRKFTSVVSSCNGAKYLQYWQSNWRQFYFTRGYLAENESSVQKQLNHVSSYVIFSCKANGHVLFRTHGVILKSSTSPRQYYSPVTSYLLMMIRPLGPAHPNHKSSWMLSSSFCCTIRSIQLIYLAQPPKPHKSHLQTHDLHLLLVSSARHYCRLCGNYIACRSFAISRLFGKLLLAEDSLGICFN